MANQRANWVHQVAAEIVSCNSLVATEELEVIKMTRKSKKQRKKQKAGLNKSILDVGFGMLITAIKYKLEETGGVFAQVPTKQVKPSQRCPGCGNCQPKTLSERIHSCECGVILDRDIASALVCLLWAVGKLPGDGMSLADPSLRSGRSIKLYFIDQKIKVLWIDEATRCEEASEISAYGRGCRNPDLNEVGRGSS